MSLEQLTLETGENKVEFAISLLKAYEPPEGYYFADSGGKDSSTARDLLIKSGVKYDGHYCVSPLDPKPVHDFLKQYHPETQWDIHARGFWAMVVKKGLPMRHRRWCCEIIKEAGGEGRVVVLGNRRAESVRRSHQCFVQSYKRGKVNKTLIRPILNFDNYDVWQYIRENNVDYCELYDKGAKRKGYGEGNYTRLGCVMCPFAPKASVEREMIAFPKIATSWRIACDQIVKQNKVRGWVNKKGEPYKHRFETGDEMLQWWIGRK